MIKKQNQITLALFWPIAGLVSSLKNWRQPWAKNVFWIACMFMGAVQIYQPEGTMLGEGADGGRYAMELMRMHRQQTSWQTLTNTVFDGQAMDVYCGTMQFLVSRFTDNPHVLFFLFAVVFGFFYSRNVWYVLDRLPRRVGRWTWVLVAFFFLLLPIWSINGVRMWTAAHVFIYGVMPYVVEKDKRKLPWCFASLLVHFSFLYAVLLLLAYMALPKTAVRIYFIAYLVTSFVSEINLPFVQSIMLNYLPDMYDDRVEMYTNENYADTVVEAATQVNAFVTLCSFLSKWVLLLMVVLAYVTIEKHYSDDESVNRLFAFALLFYSFSNLFALVPSGGRFLVVSRLLMVPLLLTVFTTAPPYSRVMRLKPVLMLSLLPVVVLNFRMGFDYYGITLLMGNFATAFFFESNVPLIIFIKSIL